ncbi:glycosyltransferase [Photobacterium ganghwense]|uniref:glycosyltransferase n=1 Tax=Photobacterium ganghwense TaxID=320778 RepID=UPI001C2DD403|nr:glycosyltransferase [Photobacterium ganghwense]MBV1838980.1 glycosyltransferase [Photobacterium ganghwense]
MHAPIDISVVITVLDRINDIEQVICSILKQSLPQSCYEIIIVDNGSTDGTVEILSKYDNRIRIIDGSAHKGSPYSARNMAVELALGSYLLFLDGYADFHLLENILNKAREKDYKLVTGIVNLNFSNNDIYEIYDAIFSLDTKKCVSNNYAPTANLLVSKAIFKSVGGFKENIRSGGDFILTRTIINSGYEITCCDNAISYYYARNKISLLKKIKRISTGLPLIWTYSGSTKKSLIKMCIRPFIPVNPFSFYQYVVDRNVIPFDFYNFLRLYVLRTKFNIMISYYSISSYFKGDK